VVHVGADVWLVREEDGDEYVEVAKLVDSKL
jgi:hypothetical protein